MSGVYVIHCPEMEKDVYKIGCSKDINKRIQQFNKDSLRLSNVEVIYTKEFNNFYDAEKRIHDKLSNYRLKNNREFFICDINKIKLIIDSILDQSQDQIEEITIINNLDEFISSELSLNPGFGIYIVSFLSLANKINLSLPTLRNILKKLEKLGYYYNKTIDFDGLKLLIHYQR